MAPPSMLGSSRLLKGALLFGLGGLAGFVVHAVGGRAGGSAPTPVTASSLGATAPAASAPIVPAMAELQLPSALPDVAPRLKMHAELEAGQLLERAHALLASKPAAALELTQEHDREFENGPLQGESDSIAVEALLALGDIPAARSRARQSLARQPKGPHAARLVEVASLK